jgi:hypothetical protein
MSSPACRQALREPGRIVRLPARKAASDTPVPLHLDALLPDDHLARLIWAAVERLDLAAFTAVLVGLWIYTTSQGETSARESRRGCLRGIPRNLQYTG